MSNDRARQAAESLSDGLNCLYEIQAAGEQGDPAWEERLAALQDAAEAIQAQAVQTSISIDPSVTGALRQLRSLVADWIRADARPPGAVALATQIRRSLESAMAR
jgi:hypothetical protein